MTDRAGIVIAGVAQDKEDARLVFSITLIGASGRPVLQGPVDTVV